MKNVMVLLVFLISISVIGAGCIGTERLSQTLTTSSPTITYKWINETLVDDIIDIKEGGYYHVYCWKFNHLDVIPTKLKISVEVTEGPAVDVYVMDERAYHHYEKGESFQYFTYPSRESVVKYSVTWTVPSDNPDICIVIYNPNKGLFTSKTSRVHIKVIASRYIPVSS